MDIKELMKIQLMTQMGMNNNRTAIQDQNIKNMLLQFLFMFLMSIVDDISKAIPKVVIFIRTQCGNYLQKKVIDSVIERPKELVDTAITLNAKHAMNILSMSRVFVQESGSVEGPQSEVMNGMVDAVLGQISKLDNIPILKLIGRGDIIINYKEKPVQITKEIFVKIDDIVISASNTITSIRISLLSNILSAAEMGNYVKELYNNHLQEIKNALGNKIYFFDQKNKDSNPPPQANSLNEDAILNHKIMRINTAPKQLSFTMTPFYSNKQFSNIYGKDIRLIEKRIKFFIDNRDWYDKKGIPYQIGLLLSGVPGCGKTSVIRAIANMTKRHIVNVNFANITTATQLKNMFYCDKLQVYTDNTMSNMQSYFIPIEQRLYVLEEIDAIGDIVKQRKTTDINKKTVNDELTLMEILTVLDGTMEVPGRMIVMTSNHPEMLDEALIRPGRIDVQVHFGYSEKEQIAAMIEGYLDIKLPDDLIEKLPDKLLSPAEIGQVLFRNFDNFSNYNKIIEDLNETAKINYDKRYVAKIPNVVSDVIEPNVVSDVIEPVPNVISPSIKQDVQTSIVPNKHYIKGSTDIEKLPDSKHLPCVDEKMYKEVQTYIDSSRTFKTEDADKFIIFKTDVFPQYKDTEINNIPGPDAYDPDNLGCFDLESTNNMPFVELKKWADKHGSSTIDC